MSLREREGLIARIRQVRRTEEARGDPGPSSENIERDAVDALAARITHLEQLVEGLQDSVHRETKRQGKRIEDLEARVEPAEISRALSADARQRGLGS